MNPEPAPGPYDPAALVDPFIAVDWPGNGLCGPYLPHALVRLGPDTAHPHDTTGYASGRPIIRFSHTHVAGTGGSGRYGNIGVIPFIGHPQDAPPGYPARGEHASAGCYEVTLGDSGIAVELTTTARVGLHRYRFPKGSSANIMIDAGAAVQVTGMAPVTGTGGSIGGFIEISGTDEVIGRADVRGGWGHDHPYAVFFAARFDRPMKHGLVGRAGGVAPGNTVDGVDCRAVCAFGAVDELEMRVGISFVSIAKARANIDREVSCFSFDEIRQQAHNVWAKTLGRIRVEGGTVGERTLFYSLFSRLRCMPTDLGVDDENPHWHSGVRHFWDFYALWDSVRNANSFFCLIDPGFATDILNCLLDTAGRIGWFPDAWIAGHAAQSQGGSSADVLFCDAALKGLIGVDYRRALGFMRKNAEDDGADPRVCGRYAKPYRDIGYLPAGIPQSVSRHLEYAYQDWCIGALAKQLGEDSVAERYGAASQRVWNLWRDDLGSFAPRRADGTWVDGFDPAFLRPDCWNDPHLYEGSGHAWSFNVQHDIPGLIARLGGAEAFIRRIDDFLADSNDHPWKEIVLHTPWLYHYAGRPDLSAEKVRRQLQKHYRTERKGLDDNEDMGCQSTFYMCSSLGIYPVMGQDLWLLGTPVFTRSEIVLGDSGRSLVIEAPAAGASRPYVVAATLDGKTLDRAWLRHGEIAHGAVIRLTLAEKPGTWGRTLLPPSPLQS